jgi:hypothetical protein
MATLTDAQKIEKYRAAANDKTIPQDARNQLLDKANEIEYKAYEAQKKKLAKGGMVSNKGVGASVKPHNMFKSKK